MPASDSRKNAKSPATRGERLPRPAHCDRWVASPDPERTSVTRAKAAMVVKP